MQLSRGMASNSCQFQCDSHKSGFPVLPKRLECGAHFLREELRLLPGREVSAFFELIIIDEFGIGSFCPTSWRLVELVWKGAHGSWNGNAFRREKRKLAFPIQTSRRDRRVCKPVVSNVIENVISREPFRLTVEDARY